MASREIKPSKFFIMDTPEQITAEPEYAGLP